LLVNLLPGLREIRAPLISGYVWLVFFLVALHGDLPSRDHPGALQPVFDLADGFSSLGIATALSVVAYLIGSSMQEILKLLGRWVSPVQPLYGEAGTHLSSAGHRDVRNVVGIRVQKVRRRLIQVAMSPGEGEVDSEPSPQTIQQELPLIRTLLLGERPELVGELDRLQSEADLRITVAIPLAALAIFLIFDSSLGWAFALVPVPLLLVQGHQRQKEAGDLLAKALRIGKANAPALESLEVSAKSALERTDLEEELGAKMSSGNAIAAFRLGNLQASGEKFEGALDSLRYAAEHGVVQAYAEIGLVYEKLSDRVNAEAAYSAGDARNDRKASELLAALQSQLELTDDRPAKAKPSQAPKPADEDTVESVVPEVPRQQIRIADYRRQMESGDPQGALHLGLLLRELGERDGELEALRRATELDDSDPQAWHQLGISEYQQGRFSEASASFERGIKTGESELGDDHSEVARGLVNLANAARQLGEYERARELQERALVIEERHFGSDHAEVGRTLSNLGNTLDDLGDYEGGHKLQERALAIQEKQLGPEHLDVARTLNNVGCVLGNLGEYERARPPLERSLAIREAQLGPDHVDVVRTLSNLGSVLEGLGDYGAAREVQERVLAQWERELGPDHLSVALALVSLADALDGLGEYNRAQSLQSRALSIQEGHLGPDHPEVAQTLTRIAGTIDSIASARHDPEMHEEAMRLLQRSLAIREEKLGPNHPETASLLGQLADLSARLGQLGKARELIERALSSLGAETGTRNNRAALIHSGAGTVWQRSHQLEKAESSFRRALEIFEVIPNRPAVARVLTGLAETLSLSDRSAEAIETADKAILVQEESLVTDHPELAETLEAKAGILERVDMDATVERERARLIRQRRGLI
jgi:tetratricopeptide (TPR) repeat protein